MVDILGDQLCGLRIKTFWTANISLVTMKMVTGDSLKLAAINK